MVYRIFGQASGVQEQASQLCADWLGISLSAFCFTACARPFGCENACAERNCQHLPHRQILEVKYSVKTLYKELKIIKVRHTKITALTHGTFGMCIGTTGPMTLFCPPQNGHGMTGSFLAMSAGCCQKALCSVALMLPSCYMLGLSTFEITKRLSTSRGGGHS